MKKRKVFEIPFLVYDVETQLMSQEVEGGWKNCFGMKLASCIIYDSEKDQYVFFGPDENELVCKYLTGSGKDHIVVSFNGFNFDSRVLLGDDRKYDGKSNVYKEGSGLEWLEMDIYLEIYKHILPEELCKKNNVEKLSYQMIVDEVKANKNLRIQGCSLDDICKATLGKSKNAHSEDGPKLFKEGNLVKLLEYNLQDVRLTKDLFLFIKEYNYIVNGSYDIIRFE
jgi:DNA polymerase elongation subunit (family B)